MTCRALGQALLPVIRSRPHTVMLHRTVHGHQEVAWVNADGAVTGEAAGGPPRTTPYRLTAVFARRDGEWRWHTFNGSEPNVTSA